jgi:hypothetical protein
VEFTWKGDESDRDFGFVAEEVESIDPLLVTYNAQGQVEGVKYKQITAVLVNALKEQGDRKAPNEDTAVDDESLLDADDKKVQAGARRATIYALLGAMLFLYPGVLTLGWMSSTTSGGMLVFFLVLLAATTVVTLWLSTKAIVAGRSALALAGPLAGGKAYLSNAKGSVIGGGVMIGVCVALSVFAVNKASSTDWGCAFSPDAAKCLQPNAKPLRKCENKTIERDW